MDVTDISIKLSDLGLPSVSDMVKQHLESQMYLRRERMGCLFESRDRIEEQEIINLIEKDNAKIQALNDLYLKLMEVGA